MSQFWEICLNIHVHVLTWTVRSFLLIAESPTIWIDYVETQVKTFLGLRLLSLLRVLLLKECVDGQSVCAEGVVPNVFQLFCGLR